MIKKGFLVVALMTILLILYMYYDFVGNAAGAVATAAVTTSTTTSRSVAKVAFAPGNPEEARNLKRQIESCLEKDECHPPYQSDDNIEVATDPITGRRWTLGQVRRYAVDEPWSPPDAATVDEDGEDEAYHHKAFSMQPKSSKRLRRYPAFYRPGVDRFLEGGGSVLPSSANRTLADANVLIFNRVPKCASSTMNEILETLADINRFTHNSWRIFWSKQLTIPEEEDFINSVYQSVKPTTPPPSQQQQLRTPSQQLSQLQRQKQQLLALDRHVYFVQTEDYRQTPVDPVWINMVRDPVDRFVSLFYFLRSKKRWQDKEEVPPEEWFSKDMSQCVLSGDLECQFSGDLRYLKEHQLTFFCGSALECKRVGSRAALQKAKYNAEKYYSVIGVSEDLESSLAVMESYLPKFFKGATQAYQQMSLAAARQKAESAAAAAYGLRHRFGRLHSLFLGGGGGSFRANSTPNKKELSAEARAVLKANMTLDYEFYEFVTQRLAMQRRSLGVLGKLFSRFDSLFKSAGLKQADIEDAAA